MQTDSPSQVFWGDTHLHASDSPDAFGFGARLDSEDALRFARGEKVTSIIGLEAQLRRPLDFLVIADHAVGLGLSREIYEGNPILLNSDPRIIYWNISRHAAIDLCLFRQFFIIDVIIYDIIKLYTTSSFTLSEYAIDSRSPS